MVHKKVKNEQYGTISAIIVALVWGLSFVAARMVLTTLSPILLATIRFIIASLIFSPIIIREIKKGNTLNYRDILELGLLGILSISIYFWLQYTGVKYVGAGISAILVVGLIPLFTGIASTYVLREHFSLQKVLGVAIGLIGLAFITLPGLFVDDVDVFFYIGVGCLLLNAVIWALYSTLSRRIMKRIQSPVMVTAYVTILGTLALVVMSVSSDWNTIQLLQPNQWLSILYLSIICSCGGYFLWNYALSGMEAVKAAVWLYIEPVVAFIGELVIFSIIPSLTTLIGGILIIGGALFTTRASNATRIDTEGSK